MYDIVVGKGEAFVIEMNYYLEAALNATTTTMRSGLLKTKQRNAGDNGVIHNRHNNCYIQFDDFVVIIYWESTSVYS